MARDRIVSGLSLAVIVVEAGSMSGSVDTAQKARRQGRKVFAVPGSTGCDELIASGAHLIDPDDRAVFQDFRSALLESASGQEATSKHREPTGEQLGLW